MSLSTYIQDNYPSPSDGDEFIYGGVKYVYDATPGLWTGSIADADAVQDIPTGEEPENPLEGDLWFDPSDKKLKVRDDDEWVEANPQPTAEDLGIVQAVAVENGGTVVLMEAGVLNFGDGLTASMEDSTTVSIVADLPVPPAQTESVTNYTLEIDTSGNPSWQTVAEAIEDESIALNDLDGVSAPSDTPADEILASNGSGWEPKTMDELGIPSDSEVAAIKSTADTAAADIAALELNDLTDVSGSPSNGDYLAYNNSTSMWEPTTAPVPDSNDNAVSVSDGGKTINVGDTSTQIPVITAASLSGSNLGLTTNGSAADLSVDLSSLADSTFNLTVNDEDNITEFEFDEDDFNVSVSGGKATISGIDPNLVSTIAVRDDGATINNVAETIDFTGDGVTVSSSGPAKVTVNIPGGSGGGTGTSPALQQTAFDKSSERADKTQFHLNGGTKGGKFRVMVKNNNASSSRNIKYQFTGDDTAADKNISAGVTHADRPGLWDSDDERFIFYPSGSNGQINWEHNTFMGLPARNVMQMDLDVPANGRISFTTSNGTDMIWSYASIGGFAEAFEDGGGGGDDPEPDADPGPNFANGPEVANYHGPYFIEKGIGHYNMTWALASGNDIRFDKIMGGNGLNAQTVPTTGNDFYQISKTSENIGLWVVAYQGVTSGVNDNNSIGWGVVLPGSSGDSDAQDDIDKINQYINNNTALTNSNSLVFSKSSGGTDTVETLAITSPNWTNAGVNAIGPNLGAWADAQAYTSWTGARDWHSATSCYFNLPGSGGQVAELRRGQLRATRQSPSNITARAYIYEVLFRVYTPS